MAARTTFLGFPQEIIEKIMDDVPPDDTVGTWRSLSTVSQFLRPLAHRRLFRWVVINTRAPHTKRRDSRSLAVKLLEALVDAPYLSVYTTRLDIIIDDEDGIYSHGLGEQGAAARRIIPPILDFYHENANLRKFVLRQTNLGTSALPKPIEETVVKILGMKSLEHVELKNVPINIIRSCSSSVKHIAVWNPHLGKDEDNDKEVGMGKGRIATDNALNLAMTRLTVSGPAGAESVNTPILSLTPPPHRERLKIQSLLLDDWSVIEISSNINMTALRWFLDQEDIFDFTTLRKLRIGMMHCNWEKGHGEIANLLSLCGDTLKEFSISPSLKAFVSERPENDPLTLSTLTSLTYLHIGAQTGFWKIEDPNTYDPMPWVCSFLSSSPSPSTIKTIVFSSSYGMMPTNTTYFGPDFNYYPKLDGLISSSISSSPYEKQSKAEKAKRFLNLQKIQFHIEEAPFYKAYMPPPHIFGIRAKWTERNIKNGMRALMRERRVEVEVTSNLYPYSTRLQLDAKW